MAKTRKELKEHYLAGFQVELQRLEVEKSDLAEKYNSKLELIDEQIAGIKLQSEAITKLKVA
ncbi:MAG: hypothetical protein UT82_C0028G0006 [Parcubacteria group bacterium GW2011_GWB1_40_14]|nr:MAG: hypothetical protein UT82_C0028G0006 [Parcubacteria group bacterium GW2011_GWB1_40_14]